MLDGEGSGTWFLLFLEFMALFLLLGCVCHGMDYVVVVLPMLEVEESQAFVPIVATIRHSRDPGQTNRRPLLGLPPVGPRIAARPET